MNKPVIKSGKAHIYSFFFCLLNSPPGITAYRLDSIRSTMGFHEMYQVPAHGLSWDQFDRKVIKVCGCLRFERL